MIGMVHLWWRCYVLFLPIDVVLYFMYYDDHGLVGATWSIMINCVVYYVKYDRIYLHASNVKVLYILGDHVRLGLCAYMCSLRVDTW